MSNLIAIGCLPLSEFPKPPEDSSPCIISNCIECNDRIWLSEKKRELLKRAPTTYKVLCFLCIAKIAFKNNIDIEMINIQQSGGLQ